MNDREDRPCDAHEQQQQTDRGEEDSVRMHHRAFRDAKGGWRKSERAGRLGNRDRLATANGYEREADERDNG